jgi:ligand-binding sensor domain-containing protein
LATENIDALQIAADGSLWFQDAEQGADSNVTRYDGKQFEHLRFSAGQEVQPDSSVSAIHQAPGGMMWFGHGNGTVTRFNPRSHSVMRFTPGQTQISGMVHQIVHHPEGALWFATESGIYRYDEQSFAHYTTADGLPKNAIITSASSSDGSIWLAADPDSHEAFTARIKPAQANPGASPFETFGPEHGLDHPGAFSILTEPDGGMWLGGNAEFGGLYHFDPGAMTRSEKPFRVPPGLEQFGGDYANGLHLDTANNLWVGGGGKHVRRFNLDDFRRGKLEVVTIEGNTQAAGSIYQDAQGTLWATQRAGRVGKGLMRLQGTNLVLFTMATTTNGLSSDNVNCFGEGPDGLLYIGTESGLARYDGKGFVTVERKKDQAVPASNIRATYRDKDRVLWFATDAGVTRYDGITWSSLDESDGLAAVNTTTITQDREGSYWFGTDKGLTRHRTTPQELRAPGLIVETDRHPQGTSAVPTIPLGSRATFRYKTVDFKTQPSKRLYRQALLPGRVETPLSKRDVAWGPATFKAEFDWKPLAPGAYTVFSEH